MAKFSHYNPNSKVSGRRYVPDFIEFKKTVRNEFPGHFKLVTNAEGKSILYISTLLKNALDKIGRGRTSRDTIEKDSSGLIKKIGEKIPTQVRSVLKKVDKQLNTSLNPPMYKVDTPIENVLGDGDIEFANVNKPTNDSPKEKDSSIDMDDLLSEEFPSLSKLAHSVLNDLRKD